MRRGRFQDQSRLWVLVLQLLGEWDLQDLKVMKMYSSKAEAVLRPTTSSVHTSI